MTTSLSSWNDGTPARAKPVLETACKAKSLLFFSLSEACAIAWPKALIADVTISSSSLSCFDASIKHDAVTATAADMTSLSPLNRKEIVFIKSNISYDTSCKHCMHSTTNCLSSFNLDEANSNSSPERHFDIALNTTSSSSQRPADTYSKNLVIGVGCASIVFSTSSLLSRYCGGRNWKFL